MKAKFLPLAIALIIGTAGYFIGKGSNNSAASSSQGDANNSSNFSNASSSNAAVSSTRASLRPSSSGEKNSAKTEWNSGDPIARLEKLSEITDPMERARAWMQFIDSLSPDQFAAVVTEFRARGMNMENINEYSMLLSAWAKVNPLEALDFAAKNTQNAFARQTILATWAQTAPDAAIQWARDNHKGDGANPWMVGVIRGLAQHNTALAESLLKEMPRSVERGEALDAVLPAILKQGQESARAWAAAITDEALRDGAMMRIPGRTMDVDPEGTADWLIANPSEATKRNLDDAIYRLAQKDKDAAMKYFQDLPAGENRSNALRGLVNSIASNDPQAASVLMDRHAPDVNDRMVEQFVWHSFRDAPEIAVAKISRLSNTEERNRMYSRSIEWWMRRDREAAFQWMSQNQLPQNVVDRLNRVYQGMQKEKN